MSGLPYSFKLISNPTPTTDLRVGQMAWSTIEVTTKELQIFLPYSVQTQTQPWPTNQ
jgi:hypothetical protein